MIPIPLEVTDLIIEYAGWEKYYPRDRASLVSCSLVCHNWRTFAQARLFRTITRNVEDLDQFLAFLEARPHIACAVRSLSLWANEEEEESASELDDDEPDQGSEREASVPPRSSTQNRDLSPDLLLRAVAALTALSHLTLDRVVLLGWPNASPLPTQAARIARLVLNCTTYKPFSPSHTTAPFDILSLFDTDHLVTSGNKDGFPEADMQLASVLTLPTSARPAVRTLELRGDDCFLRCNLDRGGLDAEQLRAAVLYPVNVLSLRLVGSLLQRCGGGLVDLSLNMCQVANDGESSSYPGLWSICSLAACTRLKTLRLHFDRSRFRKLQRSAEYQKAYSAILESAPPTSLRELVFGVLGLVTVDGLFTAVMKEIIPLILQSVARFPGLQDVRILVRDRVGIDRCMGVMHDLLPAKIVDSGVVKFEHRMFDRRHTAFERLVASVA
ncbi:hypothetical protein C8Q79DRAFT_400270 [Trametes meyenii]|nr:hypothetical protein C8Q79DRAFT_400270 [Trametes meyenii]